MKFLSTLEKKKPFWVLLGFCVLFFILRLPSLIEPNWYGDEGIYQVIGQALHNGQMLYHDVWDNKPPLLYVIYAMANGEQMPVRLVSIIVGLASVIVFFFLSKALFVSHRIAFITTFIYVLLFGTPFLEGNIANAENFIILPVMLAALLIYKNLDLHSKVIPAKMSIGRTKLFVAGLLLGIAFLFKIVAIFDTAAFTLFLILYSMPKLHIKYIKSTFLQLLPLILGFLIPFTLATLYFASQNILTDYLQSVFSRNVDYVGFENVLFGIPQGLLILKIILLTTASLFIISKRSLFSPVTLFLTLWLVFALFNANFSGRPYTHYLLVILPSFCLLIGYALSKKLHQAKSIWIGILAFVTLLALTFPTFGIGKTFSYYQNTILFLNNQLDVRSYQAFFDPETPRDYAIASFVQHRTKPSDKIFIWGDSAQLYVLSHKLPPYKYTVSYHVKESPELLEETQNAIDATQPKYIITLPESEPLPFRLPLYIMRFNIDGAIIYERSI